MQKSLQKEMDKVEIKAISNNLFMSYEELKEEFDRSNGNIKLFFDNISERVSKFYMDVSSHVL